MDAEIQGPKGRSIAVRHFRPGNVTPNPIGLTCFLVPDLAADDREDNLRIDDGVAFGIVQDVAR